MDAITLIKIFFMKTKIFWYGAIVWWILQYFEFEVWNKVFNLWKFMIACIIFWLLTQFSFLLIEWDLVWITERNESKDIVLSVLIASFAYLVIPFVLQPENRGRFIESILNKFWLVKKGNIEKDIFK